MAPKPQDPERQALLANPDKDDQEQGVGGPLSSSSSSTANTPPNDDNSNDDGPSTSSSTPLLPADIPSLSKSSQRRVTLICAAFIFIIEVSVFLMDPPFQQILEDVICHGKYPDHTTSYHHYSGNPGEPLIPPGSGGGIDKRCKAPDVQKLMTMVKSATMIPQLLCTIIVQVPYGRVADAYGRRLVLALSMLGISLSITANLVILSFPDIFSIWLMIPASLFLMIGGGPTMTTAMIWTMLSDVIPAAERAGVFYLLSALVLVLNATLYPLAGWLMTYSPWLPLWGGFCTLWIGVVASLFLPETSIIRKKLQQQQQQQQQQGQPNEPPSSLNPEDQDQDEQPATTTTKSNSILSILKRDAIHIWRFIISSRQIMTLSLLTALHNPFVLAMVAYGLQYMTARFEWDWSTATYITTISRVTSVIFLLFVLPFLSTYMVDTLKINPFKRDLYLFRSSTLLLALGCFLFSMASRPWMMMVSQVVYGLSFGYGPQARALVTALVEPHMLATLNTTLSTLEGIMALIAAPSVAWLLGKGFELGGNLIGLPYLVLSGVACLAILAALTLRVPNEKTRVETHA